MPPGYHHGRMHGRGAIAAGDPQTADAGAAVLRAGGNAVDATLAAAFAAFVAEAPLCSPAGGGALLFGDAEAGFSVVDAFTVVPGAGGEGPGAPLDFHDVTIDFGPTTQVFHVGRGAAAVPSILFGLLETHARGGSLPLGEVVAPAVRLARDGYRLEPWNRYAFELLEPILTLTPGVRRMFGYEHGLPDAGAKLHNPELADTFEGLARGGTAFLRGLFADAVIDGFGPARGGLLTRRDIEGYVPAVREPLTVDVLGHRVLTNPPPSSGGALIALGLRVAETLGLDRVQLGSAEHMLAIASLIGALSDARDAGYDDRIREPGAVEALLSDDNVARVRERSRTIAATRERSLGGTTHISVVDGRGRVAALTMSNGEGCGHAIDGLGIHMNNFLGEEDINPHGFHALAAGTRMTTMMAPTVVLRDGRPRLVLGSGGSNRIRSAILQALLGALVFDRHLDACVDDPRVHVEGHRLWFEEPGLPAKSIAALAAAWPEHTRFPALNMYFGGVHMVGIEDDRLVGGGDSRRGGAVRIVA